MYGDSFATFYRASQIRIFSALDNALSQKAEETLTEFAAVKNAEVQLQTSLGNRQGQLGINLIGAFAESQNLGIGWQVRAFGGQNDTKGMNAGIFYRRVQNDLLYGINAFADYEDGDNGSFLRYSIGGELQNRYGALVASYYTPITGDKHTGEQVAFSREGYDFNLRLNIPRLDFLNARVDYYHYHGKYNVKEDKGLRYGAEAHLFPGLRVALLYDDDGEELGGDISYTHTIGEVQQAQTANEQWTPDLFAAVSREHSQRIVSVNVAPSAPSFVYRNRSIVRPATLIIGSVNIPAGYAPSSVPLTFSISPDVGFTINADGVVSFNALEDTPSGITAATIFINAAVSTYATLTIALNVSRASSPPSFQSVPNRARAVVGTPATIGIIDIPRGYFDNTPTINISQGLTQSGGTLIWNPVVSGAITFGIEVSDTPPSQTATFLITATGFVEVGRVANVQFTARIETNLPADSTYYLITTDLKILMTLPPSTASRPYVLTVMGRDWDIEFRDRNDPTRIMDSDNNVRIGSPFTFLNQRMVTLTLTIVQGSEEYQSTLYAQVDIDSHLPPSFPPLSFPPFPQMPKLAFADPVILARIAGIQTFSRHSRLRENDKKGGNDGYGRRLCPLSPVN